MSELKRTKDGFSVRLRYGRGRQARFVIKLKDEREAAERAERLAELARLFVAADKHVEGPIVLKDGAEQLTEAGFREVEAFARELCKNAPKSAKGVSNPVTFRQLGELWTNGDLHRRHPDHVKLKRSVDTDLRRLEKLYKSIGDVPLARFTLDDAERAMGDLPNGRRPATRRHYGQLIAKVLRLAEYPCRLIKHSPLPRGFLPKVGTRPALSYLYPAEEAQLLACADVPLMTRLLYGVLAREGLRLGEALALRWHHLDLAHGTVRLERTKTGEARTWALGDSVVAAFRAVSHLHSGDELVFPDVDDKAAKAFRAHLGVAKVTRAELFERNEHRRPIRVHDLRATFITLALAGGRTEAWVQDRTGHTTSAMLNRYRRQARHAAELNLGQLRPLNTAIPELVELAKVSHRVSHGEGSSIAVDIVNPQEAESISSAPGVTRTHDRWIRKTQPGGKEEQEPENSAPAAADNNTQESADSPEQRGGESATGTEHDAVALELAQALTAAITAGRWELANRVIAELEARRVNGPAASVVDLAEARARKGGDR